MECKSIMQASQPSLLLAPRNAKATSRFEGWLPKQWHGDGEYNQLQHVQLLTGPSQPGAVAQISWLWPTTVNALYLMH